MKTLLLFSLLSLSAGASVLDVETVNRGERKLVSELQEQLVDFSSTLDKLSDDHKNSEYELSRIDLELALSTELGIKLFSTQFEKGIDLIWEKKKEVSLDEEIEVTIGHDEKETAGIMLPHFLKVLGETKANSRLREKVIKILFSEARKIHRYIEAVASFNGSEDWYVANYLKNFYFSASGDLLFAGVTYDKRLRFRFKTPAPMVEPSEKSRFERRVHRRLRRLSRHFAEVAAQDGVEHRFTMNRVRYLSNMELGIDLEVGEISKGKGLLLEWRPTPNRSFNKFLYPFSPGALRSLATIFENSVPDGKDYHLAQIRIKGSLEHELKLLFFSVTKSRDIEYHYRIRP